MADFELYVSQDKFTTELGNLDGRLSALQGLLSEYQAQRQAASQVWGDQDENLAKAYQVCDSAIAVVSKKIEETLQSKNALQAILSDATSRQSSMGSFLDQANAEIQSLL